MPQNVSNPGSYYEPLVAGRSRVVLSKRGGEEGGNNALCAGGLRMECTRHALPAGAGHLDKRCVTGRFQCTSLSPLGSDQPSATRTQSAIQPGLRSLPTKRVY